MPDNTSTSNFSTSVGTISVNCNAISPEVTDAIKYLNEVDTVKRLFAEDATLWTNDPKNTEVVNNRMGWLKLPTYFKPHLNDVQTFADAIIASGFKHAVVLGMGGSSLCSVVTRQLFDTDKNGLQLLVLDNTAPEAVKNIEQQIDLEKTVFIVASKSGTTTEPNCFFQYFFQQLKNKKVASPGSHFIAITDPGTPLQDVAQQHQFRMVFTNPPTIGGRYSALSFFGLVPMALCGVDVTRFLATAEAMEHKCQQEPLTEKNECLLLGAVMGGAFKAGRNKITFVMDDGLDVLGYWTEQLIAESTGKDGKGIVPINGEKLGDADSYKRDRLFVHIYSNNGNEKAKAKLNALQKEGHPLVSIQVSSKHDIGGEYYRWEAATAIAGIIMGINPFNEPNVAESKANTERILSSSNDEMQQFRIAAKQGNISVYTGKVVDIEATDVKMLMLKFFDLIQPFDYVAWLPYLPESDALDNTLQQWREQVRTQYKTATTLLHGPRYLHSTGQLHKGGADNGLYILLIADKEDALPIPGEKYGFDTLHQAQAIGDFMSLSNKGRRVINIHLGKDVNKGLAELWEMLNA